MADITITDNLSLTEDLKLADDSNLAKAGLTQLVSATTSFVKQLGDNVDKAPFQSATFGAKITAPSQVIDKVATLAINAAASGQLDIRTVKDKVLFDDDGFSPTIPITATDCWVGFELDTNLTTKVSGSANGFGASLSISSAVSFLTYVVQYPTGGIFPSLKNAITATLNGFSVSASATALRNQAPGTVNVNHLAGTVKVGGSYQFPMSIDALASAQLPFNYSVKVAPAVTLKVAGEVAISGDFVIRCYKVSASELRLGCYKTKGSTLTADFTAGAGIQAKAGQADLIAAFFGAVLPNADLKKAGITDQDAAALKAVLKDSIDRSLSISLNAECSASRSDEAAIFCTIDLAGGDAAKTDLALAAALAGDWTQLVSLPNVQVARNVLQTTEKHETKLKVNLLGIYNAESVDTFVKSCTIIHDDTGAVTVTDKVTASHISLASTPLAADPDKLRRALSQAFLATATYTAARSGLPQVNTDLSITQSYFRYQASMDRQAMREELLLGPVLGLFAPGTWDKVMTANRSFTHALIDVTAKYGVDGILSLFFADPKTRVCRSVSELNHIGRQTMAALIDPKEPTSAARLSALSTDTIWAAMDELGVVRNFSTIPDLQRCTGNEIADIGTDWTDVTWWVASMTRVGPALAQLLTVTGQSKAADPTKDPQFMSAQDKLAQVLGQVGKNARGTFARGWGIAVMNALSKNGAALDMTITTHEIPAKHYAKPSLMSQSGSTVGTAAVKA
jgi:hypothetical protein